MNTKEVVRLDKRKRGRPTINGKRSSFSVRVDSETREKVDAIATQQNRSTAFVIRELIELSLKSLQQPGCGSACKCQP